MLQFIIIISVRRNGDSFTYESAPGPQLCRTVSYIACTPITTSMARVFSDNCQKDKQISDTVWKS